MTNAFERIKRGLSEAIDIYDRIFDHGSPPSSSGEHSTGQINPKRSTALMIADPLRCGDSDVQRITHATLDFGSGLFQIFWLLSFWPQAEQERRRASRVAGGKA